MDLTPRVLEGRVVRLVPLANAHAAGLVAAAADTDPWTYFSFKADTEERMRMFIGMARQRNEAGTDLGFAIELTATGELIGATGLWAADPTHRRVEIGASWITKRWQRTAVNTEAKLLLLTYAFEELDCIRVEFKTDVRNTASRKALTRIGAVEEGTLRHHMVLHDGRLRNSVYFSVLAPEWPGVKTRLERFSAREAR